MREAFLEVNEGINGANARRALAPFFVVKIEVLFGSSASSMMKDEREGKPPSRLAHGADTIGSIKEEATNIIEDAEEPC
jgi:hypothetical protein